MTIGVLLFAIVLGSQLWRINNTPERICDRARWSARGAWEDTVNQLDEIHARLAAQDEKLIERGRLDSPEYGRWRMWRSAQEGAEEALTKVYEDPMTARTAAMEASAACRVARETSPKVMRGDDESRQYTPGGRALKSCARAAEESEFVWNSCSFMVAEIEAFGGASDLDLDFFKGCSI